MANKDEHPTMPPSQSSQIPWGRALIRSGFLFQANGAVFDFSQENQGNRDYLRSVLARLEQQDHFIGNLFSPDSLTVDEKTWLAAIEELRGGAEGGRSNIHDCELEIMDTYMAGIVRWVNVVGIETCYSCDGHTKKEPIMDVNAAWGSPLLDFIVQGLSDGHWRFNNRRLFKGEEPPYRQDNAGQPYDRHWLLDVAEAIHQHQGILRELVTAARRVAYSTNRTED